VIENDKLLKQFGSGHLTELDRISVNLRQKLDDPSLWGEEKDSEIGKWVNDEETSLLWLKNALQVVFNLESSKFPGHDTGHIVDNLEASLRMFDEYRDSGRKVSDNDIFEVVLACLIHDTGRYSEVALEKLPDKKSTLFLPPAFILKNLSRTYGLAPEPLLYRVLYDISSGSKREPTGHLTTDIVLQADREQLIGTATISRGLAFDVALAGRKIEIPLAPQDIKTDLSVQLPLPDSEDDKYWLVQYEFYMRNIFSPTSPEGNRAYSRIKKENAVILMLAIEDCENKIFSQIFGPEIRLISPPDLNAHWTKKPIAKEIFDQAIKEEEEFFKEVDNHDYVDDLPLLVELSKELMTTDGVSIPEGFEDVMKKKLEECSGQARKNFWMILKYTSIRRHGLRCSRINRLEKQSQKPGVEGWVSQLVLDNLKEREIRYKKNRFNF